MNTKNRLYPKRTETRQERSAKAKQFATEGEDRAVKFLSESCYEILARNFRASRVGEIDIVALDADGVLVFVEVKTRRVEPQVYGIHEVGFEAVGYLKQRKIIAAAEMFMQKRFLVEYFRWRYDVIVIE